MPTVARASRINSKITTTQKARMTQGDLKPHVKVGGGWVVGGSSLAVSNAKLLPDRVLVDVGLQACKVIAERPDALLADVVHVHGRVGRHDGSKLSGLAVLQGELAHKAHIPAVA